MKRGTIFAASGANLFTFILLLSDVLRPAFKLKKVGLLRNASKNERCPAQCVMTGSVTKSGSQNSQHEKLVDTLVPLQHSIRLVVSTCPQIYTHKKLDD